MLGLISELPSLNLGTQTRTPTALARRLHQLGNPKFEIPKAKHQTQVSKALDAMRSRRSNFGAKAHVLVTLDTSPQVSGALDARVPESSLSTQAQELN